MKQRIPQVGDVVVISDEFAHEGLTSIVGVLKPGEADSAVVVLPAAGVVRDNSRPIKFSPYPRRSCWSWPIEGETYNEPSRTPTAINVPPRR